MLLYNLVSKLADARLWEAARGADQGIDGSCFSALFQLIFRYFDEERKHAPFSFRNLLKCSHDRLQKTLCEQWTSLTFFKVLQEIQEGYDGLWGGAEISDGGQVENGGNAGRMLERRNSLFDSQNMEDDTNYNRRFAVNSDLLERKREGQGQKIRFDNQQKSTKTKDFKESDPQISDAKRSKGKYGSQKDMIYGFEDLDKFQNSEWKGVFMGLKQPIAEWFRRFRVYIVDNMSIYTRNIRTFFEKKSGQNSETKSHALKYLQNGKLRNEEKANKGGKMLILPILLQLGHSKCERRFKEFLFKMCELKAFCGILGGRGNNAYFIFGTSHRNDFSKVNRSFKNSFFLYFDPHTIKQVQTLPNNISLFLIGLIMYLFINFKSA